MKGGRHIGFIDRNRILKLLLATQIFIRIIGTGETEREGQETVSTRFPFQAPFTFFKPRSDLHMLSSRLNFDGSWQIPILRRKQTGQNGFLLISDGNNKPNKQFKTMCVLLIVLAGDVQLNPGPVAKTRPTPRRCATCDKLVKKSDRFFWCDECCMDVHPHCAGIAKNKYLLLRHDSKPWYCSACSAPCGMCAGDIFDGDNGLQCDQCNDWIHPSCCDVDNETYAKLQTSNCTWICPTCNESNFTDHFFDEPYNIHHQNPYDVLYDETNCSEHSHFDNDVSISSDCDFSRKAATNDQPKPKTRRKIRCIQVNCRSIRNKVADLVVLNEIYKPDILCGAESWLNSDIKSNEIFPPSLAVYREDRITETTGGGVFQAISNDLLSTHDQNLTTDCEVIWTETKIHGSKPLIVGTYYRSNDNQGYRIDQLDQSIAKLGNKINTHNVILTGDFNVPNVNWTTNSIKEDSSSYKKPAEKLIALAEEHGLTQCVTEPTRIQDNCENILDLVFTNNPNCVEKITIVPGMADHRTVIADLNLSPKIKRRVKRKVFIRKKADTDSIKTSLTDFQQTYMTSTIGFNANQKWKTIHKKITEVMNDFVPHRYTSTRYNLPWFNRQLRRLCRRKQRLYNKAKSSGKPEDWSHFKSMRSSFKRSIRAARINYLKDHLNSSLKEDPKSFWTYVKNLRSESQGVADLKQGTQFISDNKEKAEILNKQFTSVFTKEDTLNVPDLGPSIYPNIPALTVSTIGVEKQLKELNPNKAQGPDEIPPWFLRMFATELAPILADLFQTSFNSGDVPDSWKEANVAAVFKKGSRSEPANYRPISLTVIICKVMEHVLHSHVMKHLERCDILADVQHGFRAKRSTETQLLLTTNEIGKHLDTGKSVDMAILDFSKAFDKVPHQRLMSKLNHYGIVGSLATWTKNFLTGRTQRVVVDGATSTPAPVDSGVPQGTVTGPLWFLLFINDLPSILKSSCRLFADDCIVYSPLDLDTKSQDLQTDLNSLEAWQDKWLMKFNPSKCVTMSISTRGTSKHTYNFCGKDLESVDSNPYLGIEISNNFSWNNQTQISAKKARQVLGVIRRNLWFCNEEVKTTAYKALVRPIMEYASAAWDPHTKVNSDTLNRVQKQAARFCKKDYSRREGAMTQILQELEWLPLETRRQILRLTTKFVCFITLPMHLLQ